MHYNDSLQLARQVLTAIQAPCYESNPRVSRFIRNLHDSRTFSIGTLYGTLSDVIQSPGIDPLYQGPIILFSISKILVTIRSEVQQNRHPVIGMRLLVPSYCFAFEVVVIGTLDIVLEPTGLAPRD